MATTDMVKIRFELEPDNIGGADTETVWATPVGKDRYRVENVPFYVRGVSLGDVVAAGNKDGILSFQRVLSRSGHSTYRIYAPSGRNSPEVASFLESISALGCDLEPANAKLVAVDVLPATNVGKVYSALRAGRDRGIVDIEEGHYGHIARDLPKVDGPSL